MGTIYHEFMMLIIMRLGDSLRGFSEQHFDSSDLTVLVITSILSSLFFRLLYILTFKVEN